MVMKVGDKLLCKKELAYVLRTGNFEVGKWYIIFNINNLSIYLADIDKHPVSFVENEGAHFGRYVSDYFYTEKEVRKMKLNKLYKKVWKN